MLKNEMKAKVNEAHSSLAAMKNKEIQATKKLSILQNIQLSIELENQSNRVDSLIEENDKLQDLIERYKREIDSFKFIEGDFTKKATKLQNEIIKERSKQNNQAKEISITKNNIKTLKEGELNRVMRFRTDY